MAKVILITSFATSGRVRLPWPELRYVAFVVWPTQDSAVVSTETTSCGPSTGSLTATVETFTVPEQLIASGEAVPSELELTVPGAAVPTVPDDLTENEDVAVCAAAGPAAASETRSDSAIWSLEAVRFVMIGSVCRSERGGQDVVGRNEGHALRRRDRRRERPHERRPVVVDLPAHQHGVVLVDGVVAVLHEHPAEVAELHGDGDAPTGAEPVDVLASLLPGRHRVRIAVAVEDLPLLEVDVDRVVPAAAAVLQVPDLAGAVAGPGRDAAVVGVERPTLVVRLDAPRSDERRHFSPAARLRRNERRAVVGEGGLVRAAVELERPGPRDRDSREIGIRDQRIGDL